MEKTWGGYNSKFVCVSVEYEFSKGRALGLFFVSPV